MPVTGTQHLSRSQKEPGVHHSCSLQGFVLYCDFLRCFLFLLFSSNSHLALLVCFPIIGQYFFLCLSFSFFFFSCSTLLSTLVLFHWFIKNHFHSLAWHCMPLNLALQMQRHVNLYELEVSLVYMESSRPGKVV